MVHCREEFKVVDTLRRAPVDKGDSIELICSRTLPYIVHLTKQISCPFYHRSTFMYFGEGFFENPYFKLAIGQF